MAVEDQIQAVKEVVTAPLPSPPSLHSKSKARDLKARLEWGEPALSIIDVCDRDSFNKEHITGAMPMPLDNLTHFANGMARVRDIYVYGASDQETTEAANSLREVGFVNVAELTGGLAAWKAIEGPTDGSEVQVKLTAAAYNVVSRIAHHQEVQRKNV
jgi:rhodanese-related sulfurtransferase